MDRVLLIATLALVWFGPVMNSYAVTAKEDYELQERCGKRADELFKREYGNTGITNTKNGQAIAGYRNQYNSKLNKCFVLLTYRDIPRKNKKDGPSTLVTLLDINENMEYGNYFKRDSDGAPFECKVSGKVCRTEQEWDSFVRPYMEE
jgi:hypothetical protein